MIFADLHCHSIYSDGTNTPEEIALLAKEKGFQAVTLTDHDTIEGALLLEPIAKRVGLDFIFGVEFSAKQADESVHILGYGFNPHSPAIQSLCAYHKSRRLVRIEAMVEKLRKFGIEIDFSTLLHKSWGNIGRPHLAKALIEMGVVSSVEEAFLLWLGEGKKAYVEEKVPSVDETIQVIHDGGGKAIIAHPHLIKNKSLLRTLTDLPFDGIEAWYATFPAHRALPYLNIAKKKNWIVTGGSDYHGTIKPQIPFGASYISEENYRALIKNP